MLIIFLATFYVEATLTSHWLVHMVRAGAAAGLIGACADWFAIIAIFRPIRIIPIHIVEKLRHVELFRLVFREWNGEFPHTGMIPKGKDIIADKIKIFFIHVLNDGEKVSALVKDKRPAEQLSKLLMSTPNADLAARELIKLVFQLMTKRNDSVIRNWLTKATISTLKEYNVLPIAGQFLRDQYDKGIHHEIIDSLIDYLADYIKRNPGLFRREVAKKSKWYIPTFVDTYVADSLEESLQEKLSQMRDRKDLTRCEIENLISEVIQQIESGTFDAKKVLVHWKKFIGSPLVRQKFHEVYASVREAISSDDGKNMKKVEFVISRTIISLGQELRENCELQLHIESLLLELVEYFSTAGVIDLLADAVSRTVKDWSGEAVSEKLEGAVGKELQFIRMNGAGLGALLGVILFGIERAALFWV